MALGHSSLQPLWKQEIRNSDQKFCVCEDLQPFPGGPISTGNTVRKNNRSLIRHTPKPLPPRFFHLQMPFVLIFLQPEKENEMNLVLGKRNLGLGLQE